MTGRSILSTFFLLQQCLTIVYPFIVSGPIVWSHPNVQPNSGVSRHFCGNSPDDPYFNKQWYLGNGPPDYGINVIPAWNKCYNGTGVTVGVVDTGIDTSNPDLQNQVLKEREKKERFKAWRYPLSTILRHQHGTEIAGIIAAKANNGIFGAGIAFGAKLADLAYVVPGKNIPIAAEALSVGYKHSVDIYSCSFSRGVDGKSIYKIPFALRHTMEEGAKSGRRGKGSLYVVSSGNGGQFFVPESCAYDEFKNNINAILVAGVDHGLGSMPTGEKCSAIMISAPTRTLGNNNFPKMLTTIGNGSTDNFGMTSAAVAVASGAIAVMLSAKPNLSNRDVMHILTRTARSNLTLQFKPSLTPFKCNGAGFEVSPQFGFGLLNVDAMVEEANDWIPVGRKITCETRYPFKMPQNGRMAKYEIMVNNSCHIHYLEHVEVTLFMDDTHAGTLVADLTSPASFTSNILPGRAMDHRTSINITLTSVQFWGSDPHGQWTLSVHNKYFPMDGILRDFIKLKLHGLEHAPSRQMRNVCRISERSTRHINDLSTQNIKPGRQRYDQGHSTTGIVVGVSVGCIICIGVVIITIFVMHRKKSIF